MGKVEGVLEYGLFVLFPTWFTKCHHRSSTVRCRGVALTTASRSRALTVLTRCAQVSVALLMVATTQTTASEAAQSSEPNTAIDLWSGRWSVTYAPTDYRAETAACCINLHEVTEEEVWADAAIHPDLQAEIDKCHDGGRWYRGFANGSSLPPANPRHPGDYDAHGAGGIRDVAACETSIVGSGRTDCPNEYGLIGFHWEQIGERTHFGFLQFHLCGDLSTLPQEFEGQAAADSGDPFSYDYLEYMSGVCQEGNCLRTLERRCMGVTATISPTQNPNGVTQIGGTSGDDVIVGTSGPDEVFGLQGEDIICGMNGDDIIKGAAGDDTIQGGAGNDDIYGGDHDDRMEGGVGKDLLEGDSGADLLLGQEDNDQLFGDEGEELGGDDILMGGGGSDLINGSQGADLLFDDDVALNDPSAGPKDTGPVIAGNQPDGNDDLLGGDGDDTLIETVGDDELYGGEADDVLYSSDAGDDVIDGNSHHDRDWISYAFIDQGGVFVNLGKEKGFVHGSNHIDTITRIQGIEGSPGEDDLFGLGRTSNIMLGSGAADVLQGGAKKDLLVGQGGRDTIRAGGGDDLLDGGSHSDKGFAGSGSDTCALIEHEDSCEKSQIKPLFPRPLIQFF